MNKCPCDFNPKSLLVTGNQFKTNSFDCTNCYIPEAIMNLMNVSYRQSYYTNLLLFLPEELISYSIKNCRDTTWAKEQILKEIGRRYPYEIIDTIERNKIYDITFLDTTFFVQTVRKENEGFGISVYPAFYKYYNRQYTGIIWRGIEEAADNKSVRIKFNTITPSQMNYSSFDILVSRYYTEFPYTEDHFFNYLREEMCIIVTKTDEYTKPIKLIRLK